MRNRARTAGRSVRVTRELWTEEKQQRSASPQLVDMAKTLQGAFRPSSRSSHLLTSKLTPSICSISGVSARDIHALFQAKCMDLSVDPTSHQFLRFQEFCSRNINKRRFAMQESGLGLHSARVVARIIASNFHFAYVNLSRNLLRDPGVVELVGKLAGCVNLVHLDISSNDISPAGAQQVLSVLSTHNSLTSLDLSSHEGLHRNRLNLPGASSLCLYLQASPLVTVLNVSGTGLGTDGCEQLVPGLLTCKTLLVLALANNAITGKATEIVTKSLAASKVKILRLAENPLGVTGCEAISRFIGGAYGRSILEQLDLSKCDITPLALEKLAPGAQRTTSLKVLKLDGNPLGSHAGPELLRLLRENRSIQDLSLSSCKLRSEAVVALSSGLSQNITLHRLNLSYNHFEDSGATQLAASLHNSDLKYLDISGNDIRNKGAIALGQAFITNSSLESVILRDNNVEDIGGKVLALGTWRSRTLVHLDLELNTIHLRYLREIRRNLDRNRSHKLRSLTPLLATEIEVLSDTPLATERVMRDLEGKIETREIEEMALNTQQYRLQAMLEDEENRFKSLENELQIAKKRNLNCLKELLEVKETISTEKIAFEREFEYWNKQLELMSAEVRGLEKTCTRLKTNYAVRRVEAMQRITDMESLRNREVTLRNIEKNTLEELEKEVKRCLEKENGCRTGETRQAKTPQPRRRKYKQSIAS